MTDRRVERLLARASLLAIPLLLFVVLLLIVAWLHPTNFPSLYGLILAFMFTPAGKFSAIGFIGSGMGVWETVAILGTVDVLVGLLLILNFEGLYRVPRLGPAVARLEARGAILLADRGWIRRLAFVGLAVVVAVPFQGTGAVAGAFMGRLLGVGRWRTLAAIAMGGYGGVAVVAGATSGVAAALRANLVAGLGLIALLLLAGLAGLVAWRNHHIRRAEQA